MIRRLQTQPGLRFVTRRTYRVSRRPWRTARACRSGSGSRRSRRTRSACSSARRRCSATWAQTWRTHLPLWEAGRCWRPWRRLRRGTRNKGGQIRIRWPAIGSNWPKGRRQTLEAICWWETGDDLVPVSSNTVYTSHTKYTLPTKVAIFQLP